MQRRGSSFGSQKMVPREAGVYGKQEIFLNLEAGGLFFVLELKNPTGFVVVVVGGGVPSPPPPDCQGFKVVQGGAGWGPSLPRCQISDFFL